MTDRLGDWQSFFRRMAILNAGIWLVLLVVRERVNEVRDGS